MESYVINQSLPAFTSNFTDLIKISSTVMTFLIVIFIIWIFFKVIFWGLGSGTDDSEKKKRKHKKDEEVINL